MQTEEQYIFVHDALLEHVRSGNTEVEFAKAREYLVKLLQPISEDELAVLDLNPSKNKSVNDLTNGYEHNETSSMKSSQVNDSESKIDMQNGDGSQLSIKTIDLNDMNSSETSKSPLKDLNGDAESASQGEKSEGTNCGEGMSNGRETLTNGGDGVTNGGDGLTNGGEGMTNGGEESEGVYDLAPRSTDTYSKKMQAYNNMSDQEKEEIRR